MNLHRERKCGRSGFTLLELLVVISIIATLMSLILPAVQSARESARSLQCKNRLRNTSLALIGQAEANGNQFAAIGHFKFSGGSSVGLSSWCVSILGYLDRRDIADRWDHSSGWFASDNLELSQIHIPALVCPDDDTADAEPGGLSYVVNCGFDDVKTDPDTLEGIHTAHSCVFDWDGDGILNGPAPADINRDPDDSRIHADTGVFWFRDAYRTRMQSIYDGADNTILATENLQAGGVPEGPPHTGSETSWANPSISNVGFTFALAESNQHDTFGKPVPHPRIDTRINAERHGVEGLPSPSSNHPGYVNVATCGGAVRAVSEDIDVHVWTRLMTRAGSKLRGIPDFLPEEPLSSDW